MCGEGCAAYGQARKNGVRFSARAEPIPAHDPVVQRDDMRRTSLILSGRHTVVRYRDIDPPNDAGARRKTAVSALAQPHRSRRNVWGKHGCSSLIAIPTYGSVRQAAPSRVAAPAIRGAPAMGSDRDFCPPHIDPHRLITPSRRLVRQHGG